MTHLCGFEPDDLAVRKRRCAVCKTWPSDDCAVQDEKTYTCKHVYGDAVDAHGGVLHDLDSRWSPILECWLVSSKCMDVFMYVCMDVCMCA